MSPNKLEVVEPQEFMDVVDYEFSGDDSTVFNKQAFINAYREHGTIYHAAQVAGIHRSTVYKWMDADNAFTQAVEDSHEDSVDMVETSVFKRALAGDALLSIFWLKAHRSKFKDRVMVDLAALDREIEDRVSAMQPSNPATSPSTFTSKDQVIDVKQLAHQPLQLTDDDSESPVDQG